MKSTLVILAVILLQQGLIAGLWGLMARLRLSRGSALQWAVATAAITGALALIAERDSVPVWAGFWLSNALLLAGFMGLRRGVERFARQPPPHAEQLATWIVTMGALALVLLDGVSWTQVSVISIGLGYVMLRAAWTVRRHLAAEFGARIATGCALPFALIGSVFWLRAVIAAALPQSIGASVHADNPTNAAAILALMVGGLLVHCTLLALVLVRLVVMLRHRSEHDGLTGLLNRRAIEQRLHDETERLRRYGQSYGVLSIDIDHFKHINDRFGHPAGDAVLREVGRVLRQVGRSIDHIARAGGEEFWMLVPGTGVDGTLHVAERLRRAVGEMVVGTPRGDVTLTVSIGVAIADHAGEAPEALMHRLDTALYRAKRAGRNRVDVSLPSVATAAAPPAPAADQSGPDRPGGSTTSASGTSHRSTLTPAR